MEIEAPFDGLLYIYNLNFYHFLKFTEGKPEVITNWLFSKQRTHQLTILWLACVARYAFLPLPGTYNRPHYYARPMRFGSRGLRKFLRPRQTRRSETFWVLTSLVPRRSRLGQSWTLPWAVTSPRDTRRERLFSRPLFPRLRPDNEARENA